MTRSHSTCCLIYHTSWNHLNLIPCFNFQVKHLLGKQALSFLSLRSDTNRKKESTPSRNQETASGPYMSTYVLYFQSSFHVKQCRQKQLKSSLLLIKDPCLSCSLKKKSKWLTETCLIDASFLQIKGYKVDKERHKALEIVKLLVLVLTD